MMKIKCELIRLPDVNNKINWRINVPKDGPYKMISWDYDKIREIVSQMKIGEKTIIEA